MKAADAKAPKFDSKWWKANKAKLADSDGAFEGALKKYETEKAKLISTLGPNSQAASPDAVGAALLVVKTQAAKKKADNKLAVGGGETKDALGAYEKEADLAIKHCKRVLADPLYTSGPKELVVKHAPQFSKYCKKRFVEESFDFMAAIAKGQRDGATYVKFIRAGAPSQVNISNALRAEFDKIAAGVKADPTTNTPATWNKAPWGKVVTELERLFNNGVIAGWRVFVLDAMLKSRLP